MRRAVVAGSGSLSGRGDVSGDSVLYSLRRDAVTAWNAQEGRERRGRPRGKVRSLWALKVQVGIGRSEGDRGHPGDPMAR